MFSCWCSAGVWSIPGMGVRALFHLSYTRVTNRGSRTRTDDILLELTGGLRPALLYQVGGLVRALGGFGGSPPLGGTGAGGVPGLVDRYSSSWFAGPSSGAGKIPARNGPATRCGGIASPRWRPSRRGLPTRQNYRPEMCPEMCPRSSETIMCPEMCPGPSCLPDRLPGQRPLHVSGAHPGTCVRHVPAEMCPPVSRPMGRAHLCTSGPRDGPWGVSGPSAVVRRGGGGGEWAWSGLWLGFCTPSSSH